MEANRRVVLLLTKTNGLYPYSVISATLDLKIYYEMREVVGSPLHFKVDFHCSVIFTCDKKRRCMKGRT